MVKRYWNLPYIFFTSFTLILTFLFYQNMKEFLLTREPLDIVRISMALFVRVEQGEWTGVLEKEVENFENVLERVLEQVPSEDVERKKKLQSFGTGKKLAKWVRAISYIHVKYIDMMYFFLGFLKGLYASEWVMS